MFRRRRPQLPSISSSAPKEEVCKPSLEPCKPSLNRRMGSKQSCASMASTACCSDMASTQHDDVMSDTDSTVPTLQSLPSIPRSSIAAEDRQQQTHIIQSPEGEAPTGFRRKKQHLGATQAVQKDRVISVSDVHNAIRDVSTHTEVAYVCSPEQAEKVSTSSSLLIFSEEDSYEYPESLRSSAAAIFIVEDSPECINRTAEILGNESESMVGAVSVLLMGERVSTDYTYVAEKLTELLEDGADDVTIVPKSASQLQSVIAASLGKAEFCRQQRHRLEKKVSAARKQCHRLFWQVAHEVLEGLPQVRENCDEVPGKCIGNIDIISKVGKGSSCEVYQCQNANKDKTCVVKVIKKHEINSLDQLTQLVVEHELLRKLKHPNIVEGINLVHGLQNMYLFMEMVGTMTLFQMIKTQCNSEGETGLPWPKAKEVFLHIFGGSAYLHDMKVAHCDLKPENIVISHEGCAKLIDFGQAIEVDDAIPELENPRGTMPFMAPEMMRVSQTWNPIATDLWSLGVIMVEGLCGNHTFAQILGWKRNMHSLLELEKCADELSIVFVKESKEMVLQGVIDMCHPPSCVRAMLAGLLDLEPSNRTPAKDIVALLEDDL